MKSKNDIFHDFCRAMGGESIALQTLQQFTDLHDKEKNDPSLESISNGVLLQVIVTCQQKISDLNIKK